MAINKAIQEKIKNDLLSLMDENELITLYQLCLEKKHFIQPFFDKENNNEYIGVCSFVIQNNFDNTKDLFLMHIVGHCNDFVQRIELYFTDLCKKHDIQYIRAHSDRKGMGRLLEKVDFEYKETIFRKAIK